MITLSLGLPGGVAPLETVALVPNGADAFGGCRSVTVTVSVTEGVKLFMVRKDVVVVVMERGRDRGQAS